MLSQHGGHRPDVGDGHRLAEHKDLRAVEQWEDEGDWVPRRRLEREGKLPVEDDREEVQ